MATQGRGPAPSYDGFASSARNPTSFEFEAVPDAMNDRVTLFRNYLERDFKDNPDQKNIRRMLQRKERRVLVDIDDLRLYDIQLANNLLLRPSEYFPAFDKALHEIVLATGEAPLVPLLKETVYYVGLKGAFGTQHVNPRTLSASYIGQVIALDGIVTRCSLVRPKMAKSVHYCEATHLFHTREYRDATSLGENLPTGSSYPTEDEAGNALTTEFGFCTFRDHQLISLQEMPERAPPGQLPRSLDVILEDDLVDTCKPGDRVQIVGVYRSYCSAAAVSMSCTFRTLILCKTLRQLDKEIAAPMLTETDIINIRRIAQRRNVTDLLARSMAPSIFGHPFVKKALLLMLLGGIERNLANGTHIRGDINMLLLGDPSTAKSQFLRFTLKIAPLAIATTGRGSSGVGLTAAVTHDKETGDRRLEAGAMVLADRGIVCIDEFDKMNDSDRVAIHEVMEQQTITIAKAGIHTSLNARCSVLAAANPTYGQYDENLEPHKNIRLPDSLLSRFDLLFIILDKSDESMDRMLSMHVLQMHRYLPPGAEEGKPVPEASMDTWQLAGLEDADTGDKITNQSANSQQTAKGAPFMGVGGPSQVFARTGRRRRDDLVTIGFLKKYIHYAKSRVKPVLTPEASQVIVDAYASLRNEKANEDGVRRTLPVTARTLETLIRLATAHAKSRLSQRVEEVDAEAANDLLRFALVKEFKRKKARKVRKDSGRKRAKTNSDDDSDDDDSDDDEDEEGPKKSSNRNNNDDDDDEPISRRKVRGARQPEPTVSPQEHAIAGAGATAGAVQGPLLMEFKSRLDVLFQECGSLSQNEICEKINRSLRIGTQGSSATSSHKFSQPEVQSCLHHIEEKDRAIFIDKDTDTVYRM